MGSGCAFTRLDFLFFFCELGLLVPPSSASSSVAALRARSSACRAQTSARSLACFTRNFTTAECPLAAAIFTAVGPLPLAASTEAPSSSASGLAPRVCLPPCAGPCADEHKQLQPLRRDVLLHVSDLKTVPPAITGPACGITRRASVLLVNGRQCLHAPVLPECPSHGRCPEAGHVRA